MDNRKTIWSEDDIKRLNLHMKADVSVAKSASDLGRSESSIKNMRHKIKVDMARLEASKSMDEMFSIYNNIRSTKSSLVYLINLIKRIWRAIK